MEAGFKRHGKAHVLFLSSPGMHVYVYYPWSSVGPHLAASYQQKHSRRSKGLDFHWSTLSPGFSPLRPFPHLHRVTSDERRARAFRLARLASLVALRSGLPLQSCRAPEVDSCRSSVGRGIGSEGMGVGTWWGPGGMRRR